MQRREKEGNRKNILVVGATDSTGMIQVMSSKGPANDGRVKPELVAFGEDGASGAAALVSGAAILVQDAYKTLHHDSLPPSSLVKAILINSADDVDLPYVDHRTGFGNLNAFRAVQSVFDNKILIDSVGAGELKSFIISVPSNAALVKISLAWTDSVGLPGNSKALVNDLDLRLRETTTGRTWLPWVLSSAPHKDSLELPAVRRRDTLNNVEQVSVANPVEGNYVIDVTGAMAGARQAFSLSWSVDTLESFYWTFPASTLPLKARNIHMLRWATNMRGSGTIEYSYDGITWKAAGTLKEIQSQYFRWETPDTLATALLRMHTASGRVFPSDTFVISPQQELYAGYDCADSFLLYWPRSSAQRYEVSELKERFLQPIVSLTDTVVILRKSQHPSLYYSITPVVGNRKGLRSNTLNYRAAANGCYISGFYLFQQTPEEVVFSATMGTTIGVAKVGLQKLYSDVFLTVREIPLPTSTTIFLKDSNLVQGENYYRLMVTLLNGAVVYSEPVLVYHFPATQPVILYPNPVPQNQPVSILSNEAGRYSVQVIDGQGRTLLTRTLNATSTQLPVSLFSKGIYFIRIHDKEGKGMTKKLVVF